MANQFENESIDFLYIDGSHEYEDVKQDGILYIPKVKKGGIIAGHDYRMNKFPGVIKAVNELLGTPKMVFKEYSWYFIKK